MLRQMCETCPCLGSCKGKLKQHMASLGEASPLHCTARSAPVVFFGTLSDGRRDRQAVHVLTDMSVEKRNDTSHNIPNQNSHPHSFQGCFCKCRAGRVDCLSRTGPTKLRDWALHNICPKTRLVSPYRNQRQTVALWKPLKNAIMSSLKHDGHLRRPSHECQTAGCMEDRPVRRLTIGSMALLARAPPKA